MQYQSMGKDIQSRYGKSKRRLKSPKTLKIKHIYRWKQKTEGNGGGFVVYHYKKLVHMHSFKMQDHATVYQAELEAIYRACSYMDKKYIELKPNYVKILTDSQSALTTLNSIDFNRSQLLHSKQPKP